jgi:hypothetical protein
MPLLLLILVASVWLYLFGEKSQAEAAQDDNEPVVPVGPSVQPGPDDTVQAYGGFSMSATLDQMKQAIFHMEGGKPTDLNVRNSNPGNLIAGHGQIGTNKGFAVFASMQDGFNALEALITKRARQHPSWNFYDFFNSYLGGNDTTPAAASQGNVRIYAEYVAGQLGVNPSTPISSVIKEQS